MNKLFYGNGECYIQGKEITGVIIEYKGKIKFKKGQDVEIIHNQKYRKMVLLKLQLGQYLSDLFTYIGNFEIVYAESTNGLEMATTNVVSVLDYYNFLNTGVENITQSFEDLSVTKDFNRSKFIDKPHNNIIENLHTDDLDNTVYVGHREIYTGFYHIHTGTQIMMTGATHTKDSKKMYIVKTGATGKRLRSTNFFKKRLQHKLKLGYSIVPNKPKNK